MRLGEKVAENQVMNPLYLGSISDLISKPGVSGVSPTVPRVHFPRVPVTKVTQTMQLRMTEPDCLMVLQAGS